MPCTNQFKDDLGDALFLHQTLPSVGDPTGMAVPTTQGSVEIALSTGTLTVATTLMTQTEVAYTTYARITPARSGTGWTSVDGAIDNAAIEQFGEMTAGGPDTVTYFNLTFDEGANYAQWFGALDNSLIINNGVNPQFAVGALSLTIT
jgi:hypothetical protein